MVKSYPILPIGKPRTTHKGRFSDAMKRFYAFRDQVYLHRVTVPKAGGWVIFGMPMPSSWHLDRKLAARYTAHQKTPDIDNLAKSLLDSLGKADADYWDVRFTKVWTIDPKIVVYVPDEDSKSGTIRTMVGAIIGQHGGYTYVPNPD